MKLLVFGGNGFVGGNIVKTALAKGWEVFIASKRKKEILEDAKWESMDITDFDAVNAYTDRVSPHIVVNVAAIADIDFAEREKELARKVNVEGAVHIAQLCSDRKIKYIFLSSDAVFDGKRSEYFEEDVTNPLNFYGKTKAEAEKSILREAPDSILIRVSLVLGFPIDSGNSFVAGLEKKLIQGETIMAPTNVFRTPIDVHTLSKVIVELAETDFKGLLHIGCREKIGRYELTKLLASALGHSLEKVKAKKIDDKEEKKAPRHKNGVLNVTKAGRVIKTEMPTLEHTIKNAVNRN